MAYYVRDQIEHLQDELADAERRIEQLSNLLGDLREYFDQRADADHDGDGFVANEEMRIMMRIDEEL
jgi:hypothetical protein